MLFFLGMDEALQLHNGIRQPHTSFTYQGTEYGHNDGSADKLHARRSTALWYGLLRSRFFLTQSFRSTQSMSEFRLLNTLARYCFWVYDQGDYHPFGM